MTNPLIFITTYPVKPGELDEFKLFIGRLLDALEANEPRALAINAYLAADGTEASIVLIVPDADAIKRYWRVVHQHSGQTLGSLVENPTSVQIYGAMDDLMLERTRHSAGSGVTVSAMPGSIGGFTRLGLTGTSNA